MSPTREVFRSDEALVLLHPDEGYVLLQRSARPLPPLPATRALILAMIERLEQLPREQLGLVADMRGPIGRSDDDFEAVMNELRPRIFAGFARIAVLVRSSVGKLQVQRLGRADGLSTRLLVTHDEAAAIAFARKSPA